MISEIMQDALNTQIAKEMYSSNLYLSMAGYYYTLNLNGFANWMRVQAQEEMVHALKLYDYLAARGGHAKISNIDEPPSQWASPMAAFEASFEHEKMVTNSINSLADLAIKEGDHATSILLQWFVTEQVEEEANVNDVLERLKMMGDFKGGLFMVDGELKQRRFVPPPANANA